MSQNLIKVAAGSTVKFTRYIGGENRVSDVEVKPACHENNGQWYCVTHQEGFLNQFEKDGHISDERPHSLVWICFAHGIEQP